MKDKITIDGEVYISKEAVIKLMVRNNVLGRYVTEKMPSSYEIESVEYSRSFIHELFGEAAAIEFEDLWFNERFIKRTIEE